MNVEDAARSIHERWLALWPTYFSPSSAALPEIFNNEIGQPDVDGFVRLQAGETASRQRTLGSFGKRKFGRTGLIEATLFLKQNTGTIEALQLGHAAREIYEGVSFEGVHCHSGRVRALGNNGQYYVVAVEISFRYDERK